MAFKNYKVYFARTSVGREGNTLRTALNTAFADHGPNLPIAEVSNENFQFRDLHKVGTLWTGSFVKLRDDAPHIVSAGDQEEELQLDDGDHIIEKCHFIYRERDNLVIWQANRSAGGLSRAQEYLSRLWETIVTLPHLLNDAELERVLAGQLYEVDFAYARPLTLSGDEPRWNQMAFDMMAGIDAAHAKFMLRAPRRGGLAEAAKNMVRQMLRAQGTEKIRVRLTDESEPYDMFMAPLRDVIRVELRGRYPDARDVFRELESAYDRQRANIPAIPNAAN